MKIKFVNKPWHMLVLYCSFLLVGFLLTFSGASNVDSPEWNNLSYNFIRRYPVMDKVFKVEPPIIELNKWYAPLPPILALFLQQPFRFLQDAYWVRSALLWFLFPCLLLWGYLLLIRAGIRRSTAAVSIAMILGDVRLWGHSLHNFSDFPLAVAYLISTLGLWVLFQKISQDILKNIVRLKWLLIASALACLPFLSRPPMGLHIGITGIIFLYLFLKSRNLKTLERIKLLSPMLFIPFIIFLLYPPLWEYGPISGLLKCMSVFSKYPTTLLVIFFGKSYEANAVPWWYPLPWMPMVTHPLAFIVFVCGMILLPISYLRENKLNIFERFISLKAWLALFAFLPLLIFLILHPTFYDEERHFTFIFPPLLVLAGLGLDFLKERVKVFLCILIPLYSAMLFYQWGIYSSIYRSPIMGRYSYGNYFMGDYWSLCANEAYIKINNLIPKESIIEVHGGSAILDVQKYRYTQSLLLKNAGYGEYSFTENNSDTPYVFVTNRNMRIQPVIEDLSAGRARLLWEKKLPNSEIACVLLEYVNKDKDGKYKRGPFKGNG